MANYSIEIKGETYRCLTISYAENVESYLTHIDYDGGSVWSLIGDRETVNGWKESNQIIPDECLVASFKASTGIEINVSITGKNGHIYRTVFTRPFGSNLIVEHYVDDNRVNEYTATSDYNNAEFKVYAAAVEFENKLFAIGLLTAWLHPSKQWKSTGQTYVNTFGFSHGNGFDNIGTFANSEYSVQSDNVAESASNGGWGTSHTPDNIDIPSLPTINLQATGLRIYEPTNLAALMGWIWSDTFFDNVLKNWQSPIENIISLYVTNVPLTEIGTNNIVIGGLDSGAKGKIFATSFVNVDCGSVNLREKFGTYLDYSLGTQCELYLPYVGIVNIDINKVMNNNIKVIYHVELMSGDAVAYIFVTNRRDNCHYVLDSFSCNIANNIAMSQTTQMNRQSAWVNGIISTAVSASSSPASTLANGVNSFANAMMSSQQTIQKGNMRGFAGLMGVKNPYLIVTRNVATKPSQYEQDYGYYSMITKKLSTLKNNSFVKCSEAHIESVVIPDFFVNEIENLLNVGVFI